MDKAKAARRDPSNFKFLDVAEAVTASVTTASSPARFERTTSSALGNCSRRREPLPSAHAPRPTARPKTFRLRGAAPAAAAG